MKKLITLVILFLCFIFNIEAQDIHKSTGFPAINKNFNLLVHIPVDSSSRSPIVSDAFVDSILNETAKYFEPIGVTLDNCEKNIIENYTFANFVDSLRVPEIQVLFGKPRRINLFIVEDIPFLHCGSSSFNGIQAIDDANIIIERACADGYVLQLAHHLGHLFGLYDTYHIGDELVNGSNCSTAGDEICDTPADPFLRVVDRSFDNEQDAFQKALLRLMEVNCEYTGSITDAQDRGYKPEIDNIMSAYPCKCRFTDNQLRKMVENYNQSLFKQF